jgi:hypothetical protein
MPPHRAGTAGWVDPRQKQRFVGVDISDSGELALVEQP